MCNKGHIPTQGPAWKVDIVDLSRHVNYPLQLLTEIFHTTLLSLFGEYGNRRGSKSDLRIAAAL